MSATSDGMWSTARTWGRMVKLSHTVFALPFAFAGAALASFEVGWSAVQLSLEVVSQLQS